MPLEIPSKSNDLSMLQSVLLQAFNIPLQHWPKVLSDVGEKNFRILRSAGEIVGALGLYESDQWFGGNPISCAGVACVATGLAHRRKGHGRTLMEEVLREKKKRGIALSTLYPTAEAFYRKVGYGVAGERVERILTQLPELASNESLPLCELDPTQPADFDLIQSLHLRRAAQGNGVFTRNPGQWSRLVRRANATVRVFGLGSRDALEGWVCCAQLSGNWPGSLLFTDVVALTPDAQHSARVLAARQYPNTGELRWIGASRDAMTLHLPCSDWTVRSRQNWMLRIVDIKAALEGRGYPPGINGQLVFEIQDPLLETNSGHWTLRVQDSRASLSPGGTGGLLMGIDALSTLFSGHLSAPDLSRVGMVSGDPAAMQTADRLFAGPEPFCPDVF